MTDIETIEAAAVELNSRATVLRILNTVNGRLDWTDCEDIKADYARLTGLAAALRGIASGMRNA